MADPTAAERALSVNAPIVCTDAITRAIRAAERAAYERAVDAAQDEAPVILDGDYYGKFLDTIRADMATDIIAAIRKLADG